VFHLMIAGRFRWHDEHEAGENRKITPFGSAQGVLSDSRRTKTTRTKGTTIGRATDPPTPAASDGTASSGRPKIPGKVGLLAIDFDNGTLIMTEAGTQKRASLHLVDGRAALLDHDPGGLEVMTASQPGFVAALREENHTLKRALTDPHLFSG